MPAGSEDDVKGDHAVAGGVSGFVTRLIFQPLDVVKIRFQVKYIEIIMYLFLSFFF